MRDSLAPYYDLVYDECFGEAFWRLTSETLAVLTELAPIPASLLDLGAGTGRLAVPLALLGYDVTAVEYSRGMADVLERRIEELSLAITVSHTDFTVNAPTTNSDSEPAYDLAMAVFTVLNYVVTREALESLARRVARDVKPGGYFVFDLAERRLFASATFESSRLRREIAVTPVARAVFRYRDRGTGTVDGQSFSYDEEFTFRYWRDHHVLSTFASEGFALHAEVTPRLRESGSRWFVLRRDRP